MIAKVKWFNNAKGYGFIEQEGKDDIFIHYSNIEKEGYKTLKEGQLIEFDLVETDKGFQAQNIKPIKDLQTIK